MVFPLAAALGFAFAATGFFTAFFLMTAFGFAFAAAGFFFTTFFLMTTFGFAFAAAGFFFTFARSTAPPLITRDVVNDAERVITSPADTFLSNGRISASITLQMVSNTWAVSSST